MFEATARLKIREGELAGFKEQAAELIERMAGHVKFSRYSRLEA